MLTCIDMTLSGELCPMPVFALGKCSVHYNRDRYLHRYDSQKEKLQETKLCTRCKTLKSISEFNLNRTSKSGYQSHCKKCLKIKKLFKRYNLTYEKYLELLDSQNDKCPLCERSFSEFVVPAVDHDHSCCPGRNSCGECVRGIICKLCNTTLGFYKENPETFRKIASYIEEAHIQP